MFDLWIIDKNTNDAKMIHSIANTYFNQTVGEHHYRLNLITEPDMSEIERISTQFEKTYQVFILEVVLNQEMTGFQLGCQIRSKNPNAYIIFVTNHIELMGETFSYNLKALNFIYKKDPLFESKLKLSFEQINKEVSLLNERKGLNQPVSDTSLKYHYKDVYYTIPFNEIISIETNTSRRGLLIQTIRNTAPCQLSLKEIISELPSEFMQIHRSVLINTCYVRNVQVNNSQYLVTTSDQRTYPISKKYLNEFINMIKS